MTLRVLPFFNGLGIVLPDARRPPEVDAVVEGFFAPEALLEACRLLEADGAPRRCSARARCCRSARAASRSWRRTSRR